MPPVSSPGSHDRQGPRFTTDDRAARVRFRRAMTLMLMTLLLPGSAQFVAGNRKVGRIALRIWLGLLALVVLTVLVGLLWHALVFKLALNTWLLGLLRLALMTVASGGPRSSWTPGGSASRSACTWATGARSSA